MRRNKNVIVVIMAKVSNEALSPSCCNGYNYFSHPEMLIIFRGIMIHEPCSRLNGQTSILLRCLGYCSDVRHELGPSESLATSDTGHWLRGGQRAVISATIYPI